MKIEAVIGANYGDEGKGLFTEYLCRNRPKPLVVMSNGGCQRGHTVNNVERGIRHVFHHFGSGSLVGASTMFSKTFLLNPMMFIKELNDLNRLGVTLDAHRSPECTLQLPSDMFINQQLEKHRELSNNKHGSCGWGIWETIVRNRDYKSLQFEDFLSMSNDSKKKYMHDTLDWQIENRLKVEDSLKIDEETLNIIRSEGFCNHFIDDCCLMAERCACLESSNLVECAENAEYETIVVENAQGLLLGTTYAPQDENGRVDIHTTPSKTGLAGALESLGYSVDSNDVTPNYISRTYITRHGAGPFPEETSNLKFKDKTNIYNEYQDSMRFGKMDYDAAISALKRISADAHSFNCVPKLVLTHMNEARCIMLEENANYFSYEDDSSKVKERRIWS